MATTTGLDLSALTRVRSRLARIADPDATPLMIAWMKIIDDDNRKGVLAGTDRHGNPMDPVRYRPAPTLTIQRPNSRQKNNPAKGARRGAFAGFGPAAAGLHNNLTSREYRRLAGPPLAPRGAFSRVVTNLRLAFGKLAAWRWESYGYWDQVVSTRGAQFLMAHFKGLATGRGRRTKLPRRDLRGVRPDGMRKVRRALLAWARDLLRGQSP